MFRYLILMLAMSQLGCTMFGKRSSELASEPSSAIPERRQFPLSKEIQACDDFYGYACDEVKKSFRLRDDRSSHTFSFNDSAERLLLAKQNYLAELSKANLSDDRAGDLAKVYQACMNPDAGAREERKLVADVKEQLAKINSRDELLKLFGENALSDGASALYLGTIANQENPDWTDAYLLSSWYSLPEHSYYEKKELMADFRKLLVDFYKSIEVDKPEQRADAIIAFEQGYMKTYPKPAQIREIISTKTGISRAEFLRKYPNLKMDKVLAALPKHTHLRNLTPDNYKYLNDTFAKIDLDTLKSLYLLHELGDHLDDAYPEYFKKQFDFRKTYLGGPESRSVREERCTRLVMNSFTKELDAELIDKIFPNFPAEKIQQLAEKVRQAIIKGIESNTWLTPKGKIAAARKIRTADLMLVKPRNEVEWDFNPRVPYDVQSPIGNMKRLEAAMIKKTIADLGKPRNRRRWSMGPLTVNAYYSPANNHFVMPMGILQYPFYDPSLPELINLGAVGVVVGHELGHGIDDKGSRYDEKGRLVSILSDEDLQEFKKRGARFIEQFNKIGYTGELALGENIGDHVGLSFAYQAAFPDGKGRIQDKQNFYIQYARLWCNVERPTFTELKKKTGPHPNGEARVNEQVKHQPGFIEAFGCRAGDKMYLPENERIRVW